jgi:hypothetical protein
MSSWADITIDGIVVHETQNHYFEWYFRKSERVIESIPTAVYYNDPEYSRNETTTIYQYRMLASTLRRRLALAGFNRQALESEFSTQSAQLIKDVVEMVEISPTSEAARFLPVLEASTLNDWISRLETIHGGKLKCDQWGEEKQEFGDELLTFMLRIEVFFSDYPSAGGYNFPCLTLESYAVALLEFLPDEAMCVQDVTELVASGWTDSFNDLEEYLQDFTTFYLVFSAAIDDTKSLLPLAPDNAALVRMLYASIISAMETYLSDTLKKQVLSREAIKQRFVRNHDGFKEKKFSVATIFDKLSTLKDEIVAEIDKLSFHNLDRIPGLYKSVLDTEFPSHLLAELRLAIDSRHDIVHRNGKNTLGKALVLTVADVGNLAQLVEEVIKHIDKQIKDGLLDDVDLRAPPT